MALETIRALNDRTRRRGVMFAAVFPNPAEPGEEVLRFCQVSGFVFPCYRDPERKAARIHETACAGRRIETGSLRGQRTRQISSRRRSIVSVPQIGFQATRATTVNRMQVTQSQLAAKF